MTEEWCSTVGRKKNCYFFKLLKNNSKNYTLFFLILLTNRLLAYIFSHHMGNDKLIIGEYLNTNVLWNVRSCAFETSSNCSSIAVCHEFGFSHRIFCNQTIQIPAWLAAFLVYFIFYFLKNYNEMKQNCLKIQKFWAKAMLFTRFKYMN